MKVTDLAPEWKTTAGCESGSRRRVETMAEAQGVWMKCPACFIAKGNTIIGVHGLICWSAERGANPEAAPLPGRWRIEGTGFHDLTINAEPPETRRSVQLIGGCNAHFHVTNGEIQLA